MRLVKARGPGLFKSILYSRPPKLFSTLARRAAHILNFPFLLKILHSCLDGSVKLRVYTAPGDFRALFLFRVLS